MNLRPSFIVFVLTFLDFSISKFIKFQENFEYLYKLKSNVDFENVGKFNIDAKISYTVVDNTPGYQELLLTVYSFNYRRSDETGNTDHGKDLSKWFSFQIKPNGEILKVYHPPEDDEVLATKKGLAGMLAAKMHDKEELHTGLVNEGNGQWKYLTQEIGNEGPHSARYTVKETETETEFKKIRNSNIIEHAKEMFEKTLIFQKELGIIHKVLIEDSFTAMTGQNGFDPHKNMRKIKAVNQFSDIEYPEMTVSSKGELIFLTKHPVNSIDERIKRPLKSILSGSIHMSKYERKKPEVDVAGKMKEIEGNITCIKNEPTKGSPRLNECFMALVNILQILPDKTLTFVAEHYFMKLNLRLQEKRQSTVIMLDAYGSLTSQKSQEIVGKMIFLRTKLDPDLIVQYMIHVVGAHDPPHPIILKSMEDICFHPEKYPASLYVGILYDRVMLALGAAARKLYDSGEIERAKNITSKINELVGFHDPWLYRQKRSIQTEIEEEDYDKKHVILLESLGNAAIDHSYEYIVSHINATNSPWIKRAGVHALRKYDSEMAAQEILKISYRDDSEEVRHEATLIYQAHPRYRRSILSEQNLVPHSIEKRGFFEGYDFTLEVPSIDWRKLLGTSRLGASFGFNMVNFLALRIAPLSGHLKVNVHDEAYARLHLGVIGENVDIIQALLCFKGDTNYNINILQVANLRSIAMKATKKIGEYDRSEMPSFIKPVEHLIFKVQKFLGNLKSDVLLFFNKLYEAVTVIIPENARIIFKSLEDIVYGITHIIKEPLGALAKVGKGVIQIYLSVLRLIETKRTIQEALSSLKDSKLYWLDLTEIGEITDLSVTVMNQVSVKSKAWVNENIEEDSVRQFTKGKLTLVRK
ncbi:uncharacterized protein LOC143057528 [Mytilus galloprovincialis]|uniref:uncharacterized protein LOC143057528 n=1 Tax=Mytilus galloprovincialis TaxID=29158 RepID=UPI003F7BBABF